MTLREVRGLLLLSAACQVTMGLGLYASPEEPWLWGSWFVASGLASAWYSIHRSTTALFASGVGVVVGCAGRALSVLWHTPTAASPVLSVARAGIYTLAAMLAFIVWTGVLAPLHGIANAESHGDHVR